MAHVSGYLVLAPRVRDALTRGAPVVALESTLISHGLPHPHNLRAALLAEEAVRAQGATPATVALHDSSIRVGLEADELEELAATRDAVKVSRATLAGSLGRSGWGGTTVSATMIVARLAGIDLFATGGIGGVHRGGERSLDISADLDELARTPVAVVCAGPKSLLDVGRTLEVLETRGVPVVGWGTHELAGFLSRESGHRVPLVVHEEQEAARLLLRHDTLGLGSGILLCVPPPEGSALPRGEVEEAVAQATREAEAAGVQGADSTPWVLSRVAHITAGRSLTANVALIEQNAAVAARIAVALTRMRVEGRDAGWRTGSP